MLCGILTPREIGANMGDSPIWHTSSGAYEQCWIRRIQFAKFFKGLLSNSLVRRLSPTILLVRRPAAMFFPHGTTVEIARALGRKKYRKGLKQNAPQILSLSQPY